VLRSSRVCDFVAGMVMILKMNIHLPHLLQSYNTTLRYSLY
jgi:hypothetical protein